MSISVFVIIVIVCLRRSGHDAVIMSAEHETYILRGAYELIEKPLNVCCERSVGLKIAVRHDDCRPVTVMLTYMRDETSLTADKSD